MKFFSGLVVFVVLSVSASAGVNVPSPVTIFEELGTDHGLDGLQDHAQDQRQWTFVRYMVGDLSYQGEETFEWSVGLWMEQKVIAILVYGELSQTVMVSSDTELSKDFVLVVELLQKDKLLGTMFLPRVTTCTFDTVRNGTCQLTELGKEMAKYLQRLPFFSRVHEGEAISQSQPCLGAEGQGE